MGRPAVAAASPSDFSGLLHWSTDGTGMTEVGGVSAAGRPVFVSALSQYLSTPDDSSLSAAGDFTWAGWVTPASTGGHRALAAKADTGQFEFLIVLLSTGTLRFQCYDHTAGTSRSADWGAPLVDGQTYCVVCRRDAATGNFKIRVNDSAEVTTTASLAMTHGTAPYQVGLYTPGGYKFGGVLASVGFAQRVWSNAEATAYYNGGTPLSYADLPAGLKVGLSSYLDLLSPATQATDSAAALSWAGHGGLGNTFESTWADQSGSAHDLIASAANYPVRGTTSNGRVGVRMSNSAWPAGAGSPSFLAADAVGSAVSGTNAPFTWFGAFEITTLPSVLGTNTSYFCIASGSSATPTHDLIGEFASDSLQSDRRDDSGTIKSISSGANTIALGLHYIVFVFDGMTSTIYLDGVAVASGNQSVGAMTSNRYTVGNHRKTAPDVSIEGTFFGVGLYGRALSPVEVSGLTSHLAGRVA